MTGYIKLFLMVVSMTLGFYTMYGLIWMGTGHELTDLSAIALAVLAIVSEVAYILWVTEWR